VCVIPALFVLLCAAIPISAHTVIPTEFRQVVADAAFILRGRVTDLRVVTVPRRGTESIVTVAVDSVLKGASTNFVSFHIPGGESGGVRTVVAGAPSFKLGEEAVFFLKRRTDDNGWQPVGLSMGVYRVRTDSRSGLRTINPPAVAGQTTSAGPIVRGDEQRKPMAVSEFESLVRLVMAGAKGAVGPKR
jgi:hypothetical protein